MAELGRAKGVFDSLLQGVSRVCILSGAGISAESGVPTFRGAGGLWRTFSAFDLATPEAFERDPGLVWEFYSYRREVVNRCKPNPAHYAVAAFQQKMAERNIRVDVVTQNIDRFHQAAGAKDVTELHGSLWLVKPVGEEGFLEAPGRVWEDRTQPLTPALENCSAEFNPDAPRIPVDQLPHKDGRLLRPSVVWFNEALDERVMAKTQDILDRCDMIIVIGTSSVVYPAAGFASIVKSNRGSVVEVNIESCTGEVDLSVIGKAGESLPVLFGVEDEVQEIMQRVAASEPGTTL